MWVETLFSGLIPLVLLIYSCQAQVEKQQYMLIQDRMLFRQVLDQSMNPHMFIWVVMKAPV